MTRKSELKRAKRIKMATRMRDFALLKHWCASDKRSAAAGLAAAKEYDARLRELEGSSYGQG